MQLKFLNFNYCRRATKSRIPRPVLSPVQPLQDAFNKRPMTATYKAVSPTIPIGATKTESTSNKLVKTAVLRKSLCNKF